jgi:hypothetical protein
MQEHQFGVPSAKTPSRLSLLPLTAPMSLPWPASDMQATSTSKKRARLI